MMLKKRLIIITLMIGALALPSKFYAMDPLGDTGMFVNNTAMAPNVLIILDNSADMGKYVCDVGTYSPTGDYCSTASCNNTCDYVNDYVYYRPTLSSKWQLLTNSLSNLQSSCGPQVVQALTTIGYYNPWDDNVTSIYGEHTICLGTHLITHCRLECDYWQCMCGYRMVATGRYLNFKACNPNAGKNCITRLDYAKNRISQIVNDIGIDKTVTNPTVASNQRLRVGLMQFSTVRFHQTCSWFTCNYVTDTSCYKAQNGVVVGGQQCERNYLGARIEAWVGMTYTNQPNCKDPSAYDDLQRVLSEDTNFRLETSISKGIPMAEALAEAGLYFAGQYSWSHRQNISGYINRVYTTPSYVEAAGTTAVNNYLGQIFSDMTNRKYKSPINWRCQKNYIILITAGNPFQITDNGVFKAYKAWNGNDWTCTNSACDYVQDIASYNLFTGNQWRPDGHVGFMDVWTSGAQQCLPIKTGGVMGDAGDVAAFLYNNDIRGTEADGGVACSRGDKTTYFNSPDYPKQNVITYVMGFSDANSAGKTLMSKIARNGGTGDYYSITNSVDFDAALTEILSTIMKNSAEYVSPVVPVSKLNGIYAGDNIYLGQFKTASGVPWIGNLKKYKLDTVGNLLQAGSTAVNPIYATCCYRNPLTGEDVCSYSSSDVSCSDAQGNVYSNMIKDSARSYWSSSADGNDIERGGAGEFVNTQATNSQRVVKTLLNYTSGQSLINITDSSVTNDMLGVSTDAERYSLLSFVTGNTIGGVKDTTRTSFLGDIIHSKPAIMEVNGNYVIFVGDNSGQLHCFYDNDSTNTISELYSFIPGEYLSKLREIRDDKYPLYFVDGSPKIYDVGTERFLTFGFRRGGANYVTLKIGNVNADGTYNGSGDCSYSNPKYMWMFPSNASYNSDIGQSWTEPIYCKIWSNGVSKPVLLVGGGYDSMAEDANDPSQPNSATKTVTKGRGIYAISAIDGSVVMSIINDASFPITGSIVDLIAFDRTGDGNVDTIYAGDTYGNIYNFWKWTYDTSTKVISDDSGNNDWQKRWIFYGRNTSGYGKGMILKFFSAPDAVLVSNSGSYTCTATGSNVTKYAPIDYIFMGTGDREHPKAAEAVSGTQTYDRIFGMRYLYYDYNDCSNAATYPRYDKNFTRVTNGYSSAATYFTFAYTSSLNWFIELMDWNGDGVIEYGEKAISQPIVFDGIMYFTTYIPPKNIYDKPCTFSCNGHCDDPWCTQDKCKPSELGKTLVYAVDYRNGNPVYSYDTQVLHIANRYGTAENPFIKKDRVVATGVGMSSQPTLIATKEGPILLVATSKGIIRVRLNDIKKWTRGTKTFWMYH
ncbi:MAG TPA: hypothetical protein VIS94_00070 [Desulfomonilia bacterium]